MVPPKQINTVKGQKNVTMQEIKIKSSKVNEDDVSIKTQA
jgi:hypothetical protein